MTKQEVLFDPLVKMEGFCRTFAALEVGLEGCGRLGINSVVLRIEKRHVQKDLTC